MTKNELYLKSHKVLGGIRLCDVCVSSRDISQCNEIKNVGKVGEDEAFTARSKTHLSFLPTCRGSLFTHIQRSNHRLACYKRATSPILQHPKPFEHQGWEMSDKGYIELLWSKGPTLPTCLIDILNCADINTEAEDI